MKNIVRARLDWNIDTFAEHVYFWDNARALDKISLLLLNIMKKEISVELILKEKIATALANKKTRRQLFLAKFQQKKTAMEELGVDIEEKDVEDEINLEMGDKQDSDYSDSEISKRN